MKDDITSIIEKLDDEKDKDILKKMLQAYNFAYKDRYFYIAEIKLDSKEYWMNKGFSYKESEIKARNKGEIVLKTGWTRKENIESRFLDKRNGYIGLNKLYRKYKLNPKLCEELEKYIKKNYTLKNNNFNFLGKTEVIDTSKYTPEFIINVCDNYIKTYNKALGRGRIN